MEEQKRTIESWGRWEDENTGDVCVEIMEQINFSLTLHAPVIPLSPLNGQTNVLRWLVEGGGGGDVAAPVLFLCQLLFS